MTKQRDGQRSKVYAAEQEAFRGSQVEPLSVEDMQALIDKWSASVVLQRHYPRAKDHLRVADGRGKSRCASFHEASGYLYMSGDGSFEMRPDEIRIPRRMRKKWILIHEFAHHLTNNQGAPHGWQFAKCYLYLVRTIMGLGSEAVLRQKFKSCKVKHKEPVTRKMTDAQREAARQRMLAYHAQRAT